MPIGAPTFREALRYGAEIFHTLKKMIDGRGMAHDGRRRGRLRAEPAEQRSRAAAPGRGDREGGLHAGHRRRARLRLRGERVLQGRQVPLEAEKRALTSEQFADMLADVVRQVPDHLHRGRHGRGRLGRLGVPDRAPRQERAARRRRRVRHQHEDPEAGHRQGRRQLDPDQDQPDRHADRDLRRDRDGQARAATPR